jgi:hypothetical protein
VNYRHFNFKRKVIRISSAKFRPQGKKPAEGSLSIILCTGI